MKKSVLLLVLLLLFTACQEGPNGVSQVEKQSSNKQFDVNPEEARGLAQSILPGKTLEMLETDVADPSAYYVFNAREGGFVIVSAYVAAEPILGYSELGTIDSGNVPLGLKSLLDDYSGEIISARKMELTPSRKRLEERRAILRSGDEAKVIKEPILGDLKWDQGNGYNLFAPDFTPIGCVATATAMIMRYWEYPERGQGVYQYNSGRFGIQGHDYNYTLRWDKMPMNKEALSRLSEPEKEAAKFHTSRFNYGVAVALDMNFDYGENGGSGTYQKFVPEMLHHFYKYPPTIKNLYADNYSADEWHQMLRAELDAGRPVQYAGRGEGGGHSFVIDGYKDNGYFSLNWGWGGISNGWFKLSALSPDELGSGGGSGGFNMDHEMIIGFEPPVRVEGKNSGNVDELDSPLFDSPVVLPSLDLYIKYTRFNQIETYSTAGRYEVYTDKIINVDNGKLDVVIKPHFLRPDAVGYVLLSVDLNHDGIFNSEKDQDIILSFEKLTSGQEINKTIDFNTLKVKPVKGKTYTMRVNISAYGYSNPNYMISGEVEDYTIMIK
ncbi:C10 family peptidase [Porphyromonadaceae bacterium W3.11]|nr:C10 family peptidase [Porphyromonadaceae bacterium W3.11]